MWNLVGGLYPGLYDWQTEVPVAPVFPPGTCVTSGITVRCSVTAGIECKEKVEACVKVQSVTGEVVGTTTTMTCRLLVLQRMMAGAITCRNSVQGGVKVQYAPPSVTLGPPVCANVTVRYAGIAAISCTESGVTAEVTARTRMVAEGGLQCCCREEMHG